MRLTDGWHACLGVIPGSVNAFPTEVRRVALRAFAGAQEHMFSEIRVVTMEQGLVNTPPGSAGVAPEAGC